MSKSNYFENALMLGLFHNQAIGALLAPGAQADLFVSMHIGDPGEIGSQATGETAYAGYARLAVPRSAAGWAITGGVVNPAVNFDFPVCTGTPGPDLTHFSVGLAASGPTEVLYKGTITPNIVMNVGVIPRLTVASAINEE